MYVLIITAFLSVPPEVIQIPGYDTMSHCRKGGEALTLPPLMTFRCEKRK